MLINKVYAVFSRSNISKFEDNFRRKFFENSDCSRQKKSS